MRAQDQGPVSTSRAQSQRVPTRADSPAPVPLAPRALPHLQRTIGNAAVARLVEAQRRQPRSRTDALDERDQPVQRSSVRNVLRGPGAPLDEVVRTDMEARFGTDFSDVRVHTGVEAQRSAEDVGATAYTSGNHIVLGAGGTDRHTLAHELTHVLQQRQGPVHGTDRGDGLRVSDPGDRFEREAEANAGRVMAMRAPARHTPRATTSTRPSESEAVQRRFQPFTGRMSPCNADVTQLHPQGLDTLIEYGVTTIVYPGDGSTVGNKVILEQLLSQTGGGSQPGRPEAFKLLLELRPHLVGEALDSGQVATAMHAINGDFVSGANNNPRNIFMGTLHANGAHSREVEEPIRAAMRGVTNQGRAVAYQNALRNAGPARVPGAPQYLYWVAPRANIPGTHVVRPNVAVPLPGGAILPPNATHYVDTSAIAQNGFAPRIVDYEVRPNYTSGYLPDFIRENLQVVTDEMADIQTQLRQAQATGTLSPRDEQQLRATFDDTELAIQILQRSWQLFPQTFTCTASYWLATYNPNVPWQVSTDQQTFNAETG